jgi:hypothetical protein
MCLCWVSVCACVCARAFLCEHLYVCLYECMSTCFCMCACDFVSVCLNMSVCVGMSVAANVSVCVSSVLCVSLCPCVCVTVCLYKCVHAYNNTYMVWIDWPASLKLGMNWMLYETGRATAESILLHLEYETKGYVYYLYSECCKKIGSEFHWLKWPCHKEEYISHWHFASLSSGNASALNPGDVLVDQRSCLETALQNEPRLNSFKSIENYCPFVSSNAQYFCSWYRVVKYSMISPSVLSEQLLIYV